MLMFFVTLVSMVFVFIGEAKKEAVKGTAEELGLLWAGSVMGEYDLDLQERYNIFGFYGYPGDISEKIDYYAGRTYDEKDYIDYEGSTVELYDHSLADAQVMKRQIVAVGKLIAAKKIVGRVLQGSSESGNGSASGNGTGNHEQGSSPSEGSGQSGGKAKIRNRNVLSQLPSNGSPRSVSASAFAGYLKSISSPADVLKEGTDLFFENKYIFDYFRDMRDDKGIGRTFFDSEIEYIICGKASESSNIRGVKLRIVAAREALNLMYLKTDATKSAEIKTAAQILTPGPAALLTEKLIAAAWALLESNNDYNLLIAGRKVPLFKDEDSWATDIDSICENGITEASSTEDPETGEKAYDLPSFKTEVILIDPGNDHGMTYEDFLQILCYIMDENVKILRVMDLMQINMKYCFNSRFRLAEYSSGLKGSLRVNGESYEVEKDYQPE